MITNKKVLIIVSSNEIGGAEEYAYLLAKGLKNKCNVTVILPINQRLNDFAKRFNEIKIKILRLKIKSRRAYKIPTIAPTFDIWQIYKVYKAIRRIKPDIIHINQNDSESDFSIIIAANMVRGAEIISKMHVAHSFKFMNVPFGFIRDKWISFFLSLFSFPIITGSDDSKYLLHKNYLINEKRIFVIHYGIDIKRYDITIINNKSEQIKKSLNIDKGCLVVGFIGRLTKQKCPIDFLKIALKVIKKINTVYFIMLGSGDMEEDIKKYMLHNNLNDRVKLLGFVDHVPEYLSVMNMLLLTSLYESFGMVLAEAGAMKKPVIVSKIGGVEEVVKDGVTGFLVDTHDIDRFAEKIIYLAKNPDIANKMGVAARKRVHENFNLNQMIINTATLYEKLF